MIIIIEKETLDAREKEMGGLSTDIQSKEGWGIWVRGRRDRRKRKEANIHAVYRPDGQCSFYLVGTLFMPFKGT